jgi:hypothetical protein
MPVSRSHQLGQSARREPMNDERAEPLRGEAAYRAKVKEIAKRNEAARAAGARQRAEKEATSAGEAAERARREMQRLREHPVR